MTAVEDGFAEVTISALIFGFKESFLLKRSEQECSSDPELPLIVKVRFG